MRTVPRSVVELEFSADVQLTPSPPDRRDRVMYFLLVDRFDNNHATVVPFTSAHAGSGRDVAGRMGFLKQWRRTRGGPA